MTRTFIYSVFYNKNEWNKLLSFIASLIESNHTFENVNIKLSTIKGQHIELATSVLEENIKASTQYFSNKLSTFLKENPSSNNGYKNEYHDVQLFSDIKNNTLHYGLTHYYFSLDNYSDSLNLNYELSQIIIAIFSEFKEETLEMKNEIIIEFLVVFCLHSSYKLKQLIVFFENLFNEMIAHKKEKEQLIEVYKENFNDNKDALIAYFKQVLIDKSIEQNENWKVKLLKLLNSIETNRTTDEKNTYYRNLIATFCNNLSFNEPEALYYLVYKTLKQL